MRQAGNGRRQLERSDEINCAFAKFGLKKRRQKCGRHHKLSASDGANYHKCRGATKKCHSWGELWLRLRKPKITISSCNLSKAEKGFKPLLNPCGARWPWLCRDLSQWANLVKRQVATVSNDHQERLGETPCGNFGERQTRTPTTSASGPSIRRPMLALVRWGYTVDLHFPSRAQPCEKQH